MVIPDMQAVLEADRRVDALERDVRELREAFRQIDRERYGKDERRQDVLDRYRHLGGSVFILKARTLLQDFFSDTIRLKALRALMIEFVFRKCQHNTAQTKDNYADDVWDEMCREGDFCALACFRGMRACGRHERFVPPAMRLLDYMREQQAALHALLADLQEIEELVSRMNEVSTAPPAAIICKNAHRK